MTSENILDGLYFIEVRHADGHVERVTPDFDRESLRWSWIVPDGVTEVLGRSVRPGDKAEGVIELS